MSSDLFTLFDDGVLDELRALNEANLPHLATATIAPTAGARTGGALDVPADVTLFTDQPCRLAPASGAQSEFVAAEQPDSVGRWYLSFAAGTALPAHANVVVTGAHPDGTPWTRSLRVVFDPSTRANDVMARFLCVDASPARR